MKDYGLVSIITPSYNCAKFIGHTIRSVQNQTYQNWELLITDDCSKDNSCEVIESFAKQDNRIKLFKSLENKGAGEARNNSIKEAQGRFVAFLDGDDMWLPQKLERQLDFMVRNNIEISMTRTIEINQNGEKTGIYMGKKRVKYFQNFVMNCLDTSAVVYDTKRIGKFYMKKIRKRQDWLLWNAILKKTGSAYCFPEFLAVYVKNDDSLSSNKFSLLKYHTNVYMEQGLSKFSSVIMNYFVSLPLFVCKRWYNKIAFKYYRKAINEIVIMR